MFCTCCEKLQIFSKLSIKKKISPRPVGNKISNSLNGAHESWYVAKEIATQTFLNLSLPDVDIR